MTDFRKLRGLEAERGDPVGPPLEELAQQERYRQLKKGKKNFDPRFGGSPVFTPLKHEKRPIWFRYPRGFTIALTVLLTGSVYMPIVYSYYQAATRPLSDLEKKEGKIINAAIDERLKDSWLPGFGFRAREE